MLVLPTVGSLTFTGACVGAATVAAGMTTAYAIQGTGWCCKKLVDLFRKNKTNKQDKAEVKPEPAPEGAVANA